MKTDKPKDTVPTLDQLMEERMAKDLFEAIRKWKKAGKPHKR